MSYGLPGIAAEIHFITCQCGWVWCYGLPGIAAEIHSPAVPAGKGKGYGLPGIAAEIHFEDASRYYASGYGLPGIAAEIHFNNDKVKPCLAMVCRESRLRYTNIGLRFSKVKLWFAGNRG